VRSYYEILGVAATASRDEIRRAYLAGARRLHPDAGARDQHGMQVLNEAWTVLRDPRRRRAYDRTLGLPSPTPTASPTFVPLVFDDVEYVAAVDLQFEVGDHLPVQRVDDRVFDRAGVGNLVQAGGAVALGPPGAFVVGADVVLGHRHGGNAPRVGKSAPLHYRPRVGRGCIRMWRQEL